MATSAPTSCNTATLAPYSPTNGNPWNTAKIKHVYRRLGFSAPMGSVDAALALTPNDFIDNLVDTAFNLPLTPAPFWGYYSYSDFTDYDTENQQYILEWFVQTGNDFINEDLRGRLAFFWMNHFVTELEVYFHSPYMFQYYNLMQSHALGNFKNLTHQAGINNAMLLYLNGYENTNTNPNENYARELFELFTLGEGNGYTQTDITETARALTGYNHRVEWGAPIYFDQATHDTGVKNILGQSGNWGYTDVIDILFQERETETANYICRKLYRFFVGPDVDALIEQQVIQPLAQTFIANNFELVPVLKQLFKSEHFFDERAVGVVIKSPVDVIFNYLNETGFFYDDTLMDSFLYYAALIGQDIYEPPDVSGWQRDENWINSSTLTGRWQLLQLFNDHLFNEGYELGFPDLAKDLTNDSNDPAFITQVMVDHLVPKGLFTPTDYEIATDVLKWDIPQNYYDQGIWNLDFSSAPLQVMLLLNHIVRMPEFQLK